MLYKKLITKYRFRIFFFVDFMFFIDFCKLDGVRNQFNDQRIALKPCQALDDYVQC